MDVDSPSRVSPTSSDEPVIEALASLDHRSSGRGKGLLFRLAAVLLGLAPLLALEGILTWLDLGRPDQSTDPFVGFQAVHPLFVPSADGKRLEVPKGRQNFFCRDSFTTVKEPREFRIFCLGDSTVQGNPWTIETSFTSWLEIGLNAADPSRRWRVVNCGGVSYATYRLVPILQEVLGYQPDLIVVYSGHNEFLEDRSYEQIKRLPPIAGSLFRAATRCRTFVLFQNGTASLGNRGGDLPRAPSILAEDVEALLDYRGGIEAYHRNDEWRAGVVDHYRFNLGRMVEMARAAGVPILLMNPVDNLRDCPPFKCEHRQGLTDEQRERFYAHWEEARRLYASSLPDALSQLDKAATIDDLHAGLRFEMAQCSLSMGLVEEARREFIQARELDVCPLRTIEPMHDALFEVAEREGIPVVDIRRLFEELSRDGIPGGDWLVDHVHPSIEGYQRMAESILTRMVEERWLTPVEGWQATRDRRYAERLASLDSLYYVRGDERLYHLRLWTSGRASKSRPLQASAPK